MPPNSSINDESFDYIIVGGGTAGLVLANRLTTDPDISVLVVEAGADRLKDPKITIPGLATTLYNDPTYDWEFETIPQEHLYDKKVGHSRGKLVGGSSAINVLALIYPSKSSIDAWGKLGNKGWDFDTLAPYYQKFHTYNKPTKETAEALATDYIDEAVSGKSGPVQSSFPEFHGPLGKAWPETFKNLDFAMTTDPLSGQSTGGFSYLSSINPKGWERSHAGSAYYAPIADRSNLHMLTECIVEKLVLGESHSSAIATGVQFTREGKTEVRKAKKEVLLCAGVFQSPQILELSGIGSPKFLQPQGINVLVENPNVGENLQDHPMSGICYEVIDGLPTIDMIRDPAVIQGAMEAYQAHRAGPLTSGFHSVASLPVVDFLSEKGKAELQQLLDTHTANPSKQHAILRSILESPTDGSIIIGMGASQLHFEASLQKDIYAITAGENYICFLVSLAHPFSRGTVHISSPTRLTSKSSPAICNTSPPSPPPCRSQT